LAPEEFLLERLDCIVDVNELQSEEHSNFAPGGPETTELFFKSYLIHALENEKFQLATALIERGADGNVKNQRGDMPLDLAVQSNNFAFIKYLIQNSYEISQGPIKHFKDNILSALLLIKIMKYLNYWL
jgi:hypothetical protein